MAQFLLLKSRAQWEVVSVFYIFQELALGQLPIAVVIFLEIDCGGLPTIFSDIDLWWEGPEIEYACASRPSMATSFLYKLLLMPNTIDLCAEAESSPWGGQIIPMPDDPIDWFAIMFEGH